MVSRQLQWAALLGWSAGIPLLAAGLSLASVSLVRGGSSLLLAGTLAMSLNATFVLRHLFARSRKSGSPCSPLQASHHSATS
jgi:hypothetical protein